MDFLSRFKGRTNIVTKDGITSIMTGTSTPIAKNSTPCSFGSPRASDNIPKESFVGFEKQHIKRQYEPEAKTATLDHEKYRLVEQRNKIQAPTPKIKTDPHFYAQQHREFYYSSFKNTSTPQNKYDAPNQSPLSYSFTYNRQSQPRSQASQSQALIKMSDQQGFKNLLNSSSSYKPSDFYNSSLVKLTPRSNAQEDEAQQARIAQMNFVERQEKVLLKYKKK